MFQLEFPDCAFINHQELRESLRKSSINFFGVCTKRKEKILVIAFEKEPTEEVKNKATLLTKYWLANHKERVIA